MFFLIQKLYRVLAALMQIIRGSANNVDSFLRITKYTVIFLLLFLVYPALGYVFSLLYMFL